MDGLDAPRMKVALAACVLLAISATLSVAQAASVDDALAEQRDAVLATLDPAAAATARRIPDAGRQLLALRAYLRAGDTLKQRWSWTAAEAAAFADSAQGKALARAIAAVQCTFAAANKDYVLHVNPEFRTLEIQTRRWNDNASVGRAAERLLAAARREASARREAADGAWLRNFLITHTPQPVPTLAAPGLSPHGRGSAIDFQVHRDGKVIAGPDSRQIDAVWEQGGWNERVSSAVHDSGAAFEGPLQSPREPWHYRYVPGSSATRLAACASSSR